MQDSRITDPGSRIRILQVQQKVSEGSSAGEQEQEVAPQTPRLLTTNRFGVFFSVPLIHINRCRTSTQGQKYLDVDLSQF